MRVQVEQSSDPVSESILELALGQAGRRRLPPAAAVPAAGSGGGTLSQVRPISIDLVELVPLLLEVLGIKCITLNLKNKNCAKVKSVSYSHLKRSVTGEVLGAVRLPVEPDTFENVLLEQLVASLLVLL